MNDRVERLHPNRRQLLYIATGTLGAVGVAGLAWPFIDQMNPAEDVLKYRRDVDLSSIKPGHEVLIKWTGKPLMIRNRTRAEIDAARATPLSQLRDKLSRNPNLPPMTEATDANRAGIDGHENWFVAFKICTRRFHCVLNSNSVDFDGGYFCPCCASHYDTAGRVRKGPAPRNLAIPDYEFLTDTRIRLIDRQSASTGS